MEKWNREEWQGRSEENVKYSNAVGALSIIVVIAIAVISGLYMIISSL